MIAVVETDISNQTSPYVKYTVRNLSNKAVRGYTILEETVTNKGKGVGATITSLDNDGKLLQPLQEKPEVFDNLRGSSPLISLTLSVDYVEFADGTVWGKDTQGGAESFAGQREGRRQALTKIRAISDEQGMGAVAELLGREGVEVAAPPDGRSQSWTYGFRVGHNAALYRLRTLYKTGGAQTLATELHK
ncbi:MAG TPA: hypothetical protein VF546_00935 [Pyrinomonadaceae bacterium]|jgi:hypothetical protein